MCYAKRATMIQHSTGGVTLAGNAAEAHITQKQNVIDRQMKINIHIVWGFGASMCGCCLCLMCPDGRLDPYL